MLAAGIGLGDGSRNLFGAPLRARGCQGPLSVSPPVEQRLAQFLSQQIQNHTSEVYGDGFREAFKVYEAIGLSKLLHNVKTRGRHGVTRQRTDAVSGQGEARLWGVRGALAVAAHVEGRDGGESCRGERPAGKGRRAFGGASHVEGREGGREMSEERASLRVRTR
jgi:hypothetical protein